MSAFGRHDEANETARREHRHISPVLTPGGLIRFIPRGTRGPGVAFAASDPIALSSSFVFVNFVPSL
jgi:hypothetical protein